MEKFFEVMSLDALLLDLEAKSGLMDGLPVEEDDQP